MNQTIYLALVIILILITGYLITNLLSEKYTNPSIQPRPFVKLFEHFNQHGLVFEFAPILETPAAMYFRDIIKAEIKSIDLNIPLKNDDLDDIRTIKIWSMYDGNNIASSVSD